MKTVSLASGSRGNAYLVEAGGRLLLIDCGICHKSLVERMRAAGKDPADIIGVIITHDHSDHTCGLEMFRKKHPEVPLFANWMTAETITGMYRKLSPDDFAIFENGQEFEVGPFTVHPFSIPHDVPDPVGFLVKADGKTYFHATDVGCVLESTGLMLKAADVATLESNHDLMMLKNSGRAYPLIQRISGNRGHLSNYQASELVERFAGEKLKKLFLAHLSRDCNAPHLALGEMKETLKRMGREDIQVEVLGQDRIGEEYDAGL